MDELKHQCYCSDDTGNKKHNLIEANRAKRKISLSKVAAGDINIYKKTLLSNRTYALFATFHGTMRKI